MQYLAILLSAPLSHLVVASTNSQAETIISSQPAAAETQTGTFDFHNLTGDPYHAFYVPLDIRFPEEFGGTPTVTLIGPPDHRPHAWRGSGWGLAVTNITTEGFKALTSVPYGNTLGPIKWIAVGQKLYWGTVVPSYLVLAVIYAPPGSAAGHGPNSVSYIAGSTAGTITSASTTFKSNVSTSFEQGGQVWGSGSSSSSGFEASHSATYSDAMDIKKSVNHEIDLTGSSQDGINHDDDEILLLLKPSVKVGLSASITKWMLASSNSPILPLLVGELNGHKAIPQDILKLLTWAGITPADYPQILARDPLASGDAAINSPRFTFEETVSYRSVNPSGSALVQKYTISNSQTRTTTTDVEDTYTVKVSDTQSLSLGGYYTAKVNDASSWGWTNKSSSSTTTANSQSAQLTLNEPSAAYSGSIIIDVYMDNIYKTFAFAFRSVSANNIIIEGQLLAPSRKVAANKKVSVIANGRKYMTFTNSNGAFVFYGDASGPAVLQAEGVNQKISEIQAIKSITLQAR